MKSTYSTKWLSDMAFESDIAGHKVVMDAKEQFGGQNKGPSPKALLVSALTGCSGMDVVSILKKMHVQLDSFEMKVETEMTEEHPKIYKKMHMIYEFKGKDLPMAKLQKAVTLSQDKYCGVSAMLKEASDITYEIKVLE